MRLGWGWKKALNGLLINICGRCYNDLESNGSHTASPPQPPKSIEIKKLDLNL